MNKKKFLDTNKTCIFSALYNINGTINCKVLSGNILNINSLKIRCRYPYKVPFPTNFKVIKLNKHRYIIRHKVKT